MGHWACYHECCGQKFPLNPNLHQNTYFCLPCNVLLITLDSAQPSNITTVVVDIQDLNLFKIWTNYETWAKFLQKESSYPLKTLTERISFKPLIHCNSVEDSLPKWTGKQEFTDSLESQLVVQRHWHKFVGARSWLPLGFLKQCQPTNMHSVSDCVSAMVPCLQWCFDTFESLKLWNSEAWAIVLSQTNRKWESGSETAV